MIKIDNHNKHTTQCRLQCLINTQNGTVLTHNQALH